MSEAPIKETPMADPAVAAAPTTTAAVSSGPTPSTATAPLVPESGPEVTSTDAAATTDDKAAESAVKAEAQPTSEGILGYKGPGLIKSLRFSKKFFWFGTEEPVEEKHLFSYIQNEKPAIVHPTVAHASQTGKGLLFFAKRVEDKTSPAGVLNLGEASDVTKEGIDVFHFTVHGHKHTFQAANKAECESWVVAVETHITEAKAAHEGIVSSDGYKKTLSKYTGPSTAAAIVADKSTTTPPKTDKVHDGAEGETVASTVTADTTPKPTEKSRSQSRGKRQSIFGKVLGKKDELEEKKEIKKEEKAEKKEEKAEEKEAKKEEKAEEKAEKKEEKAELKEEKKEEGQPAVVAAGAAAIETHATPATTETTTAPKANKRGSVFGSLFKKDNASPTRERKEKEVAPAVPAKDTEVVPAVAPQLDPVATETPAVTEIPAVAPADASATPAAPATTAAVAPEPATKDKRRSSFFGTISGKKEKKVDATSDAEATDGEGKKSAGGKLGGLFRKASRSVKGSSSPTNDSAAPPLPSKDTPATTETTPATESTAVPTTNGNVESAAEKPAESTIPQTSTATPAAPAVTASA